MSTIEEITADIEQEAREIRRDAVLTAVTFVGLIVGVLAQFGIVSALIGSGAFLFAYLAGGLPAAKEAVTDLLKGKLNIDLLMVAAALAAAGVGEVRDGAILLFLFSLAGTLEAFAMGRTKRAVAALMQLRPDEASRMKSDGSTERVSVEQLLIDDLVIVRPGERLPVDGVVTDGFGAVDQSSVTGESVPVDKEVGDNVFAGTVNQNAVLTIRVTKLASESTLAKMIDLVTEAQEKRSPSERFSDWFGERYTFVVLFGSIIALGGFILFGLPMDVALYKAATLLVVASPCAIVISVPAAVLAALAASARQGVLFKGGAALETFGHITAIAFDKTGTLTEGKMAVREVWATDGNIHSLLTIAGALESQSEHPIARSVTAYVAAQSITGAVATGVTAVPGKGVKGIINGVQYWAGNNALAETEQATMKPVFDRKQQLETAGMTTVVVGRGSEVLGIIGVADTVRTTTKEAIANLIKSGITSIHLLSGDNARVAEAVGASVGIPATGIHGGLLPGQKVDVIHELQKHDKVAFVGDGVNDAPALATADVGIAMGVAGSDVALEAADVALLSDDLEKIAYAHRLSKKANQIIKQNLYFAVSIMVVMVVTTIFFDLPLPLGVIGHEGGTILVVLNGLRLLWQKV
jgi:Zn2+/Cd2+-exporting ATPase